MECDDHLLSPSLDGQVMKKPGPAIQLTGERRQVSALFYDVVGSTELLVRSDPEEFFRLLADFHRVSEKVIRRHGGFLHQKQGDGGCGYFGYPEQAEDFAERAVRASLELIASCDRLQKTQKVPFNLRVAVATSLVVIASDGSGIVGTAPVLAARLQGEAKANTVVVADSTYQLTRSLFDYQFLRNARLKGFEEPIAIWRPISTIETPERLSSNRSQRAPMHGRDGELERLLATWRAASSGAGRSVTIVGDAGIGKSRLLGELRRQLRLSGDYVAVLQCHGRLTNQPLHPFTAFLETTLGKVCCSAATRDVVRRTGPRRDGH